MWCTDLTPGKKALMLFLHLYSLEEGGVCPLGFTPPALCVCVLAAWCRRPTPDG